MDQPFAAGSSAQDRRLRVMVAVPKNTTLQTPSGSTSIEDSFQYLKNSSLTANDLVVGSHASDGGFLLIALAAIRNALPVSHEDVDARAGAYVTQYYAQTCRTAGQVFTWFRAQKQTGRSGASSGMGFDHAVDQNSKEA